MILLSIVTPSNLSSSIVRTGDISLFYLFVFESQLFVTWPLLGRERTVGMSVCVWRPLLFSAVVIWRISIGFLGAINVQGKEKSHKRRKVE